jgi:hypothetical protein
MSEQNTQVQPVELAPEQIEAKVKEIQAEVAAFNADPGHERYIPSQGNRDALETYLREHDLDITREALHLAFSDLSKAGKLSLYEESKLAPPERPKEKAKDDAPPIGKATGDDLGVGLIGQQRARKTSALPGVQPSNNREAFARAREKAASQKVPGGRLHF